MSYCSTLNILACSWLHPLDDMIGACVPCGELENVWILVLSLCVPNPTITFHVCRRPSTEKGWKEVAEAFENLYQNVFTDLRLKI